MQSLRPVRRVAELGSLGCMKLSFVIIIIAVACTSCKRPADVRMEKFASSVRQTIAPGELETWALKTISDTPHERNFTDISTNNAPKGVRDLMTNFATLQIVEVGSSNNAVVLYARGGGFGHWGFAVGAPTYICDFGHTQEHWTNGIWFWTE